MAFAVTWSDFASDVMKSQMPKLIGLLAVTAALTVLMIPLPHPLRMGRLSGMLDLGHFVLFASLTFCLFWPLKGRAWSAFGLAVALAVFSEAGQSMVGRTASVDDALLGMLGALSALIVLLTFRRPWSRARIVGAMAAVLVLAAWPLAKAIPYALDAWSEYREFPVLCDFQTPWQGRRWLTPGAVIRTVPGGRGGETSVGEVNFTPSQNGAGTIVLKPLIGEWSGYRQLCCEFSFDGDPMKVSVLLQTGEGECVAQACYLDRVFAAGDHCVSIDLSPSRSGRARQVDLSRVRSLSFKFAGLKGLRTLLLHKVFLASPRNAAACAYVVRGFVDRVEISCEHQCVAVHRRSYGPERFVLQPRHYLPLLERKPGCLDQGRAFQGNPWGEDFALLRRELEHRSGDDGSQRTDSTMKENGPQDVNTTVPSLARQMADAVARKDLAEFGRLVDRDWEAKKQRDPESRNDEIEDLPDRVRSHVFGAKLLGAGGGGFLLLVCRSPDDAPTSGGGSKQPHRTPGPGFSSSRSARRAWKSASAEADLRALHCWDARRPPPAGRSPRASHGPMRTCALWGEIAFRRNPAQIRGLPRVTR